MSTSAVSSLDVLVLNILFKKEKTEIIWKIHVETGHNLGN